MQKTLILGIVCGIAHAGSALAQQASVDPSNARILNVSANGTGCPAGTWTAELGEDGLTAELRFRAFEAAVDADRTFDTKNCQLGLELANTDAFSYAVESASFQGLVTLATGVSAEITTQAYISGSPGESTNSGFDLEAPFDGGIATLISLADTTTDELTWTSCGPAYDLNLNTRIILRNAPSATTRSSVGLNEVDPQSTSGIRLNLVKRGC